MKTLPANILLEKNKLETKSAWLAALDCVFGSTKLHYVRNAENLVLVGTDYEAAECVAHWKLDDNAADTTVADSSYNGNTGTLGGGDNTEDKSIAGKVGEAFDFNGTDDYVDCGDPFQSTFRDSFSVSFWAKPDDGHPASDQAFLGAADTTDGISKIVFELKTTGKIMVQYHVEGAETYAWTESAIFADGAAANWAHIIVTADSTVDGPNAIKIYVDGDLQTLGDPFYGDTTGVDFANFTTVQNLHLGAIKNTAAVAQFYDGLLDNVMLFSRALDQEDITALYNRGNGAAYVPLLYSAFNFDLDMSDAVKGELPKWTLRAANVTRVLESYLESRSGAVGDEITVRAVNSDYPGEYIAGLAKTFGVTATSSDAQWVTFSLGGPNLLKRRFPLKRYHALHCAWTFKSHECGYSGDETSCERTLEDCLNNKNNAARFGGFPGIRSGTLRLA